MRGVRKSLRIPCRHTVLNLESSLIKIQINIDLRKTRFTPDRWQSKTLLTIDERGSKIARNGVFDCHLVDK